MKLALFDFDGVIIDSESASFEAWRRVYAAAGVNLSRRQWIFFVGSATRSPVRLLESVIRRECPWAQREKDRLMSDLCSAEPARHGVPRTLFELTSEGVECWIVSNGSWQWVEHHLERLALREYFTQLHCGEAGTPVPKKSLYRRALPAGSLRHSVAIEDSLAGARSARDCGIPVLVFPNPVTSAQNFSEFQHVLTEDQPLESAAVIDAIGK